MVGEVFTGFWDVAFLPSSDGFSTTFLNNCGRGECVGIATCLKTVVGGNEGYVPCKILSLQQSRFFVLVEFHGDHRTVAK